MKTEIIQHGDIAINFRRSKRAKRLKLQLNHSGEFAVVAPWMVPKKLVQVFINQNSDWIQKQSAQLVAREIDHPKFTYRSGDQFYYFGERIELVVKPCIKKRPSIKVREDKMMISLYSEVSKSEGIQMIKKTIEKFYRQKAEEVIHDRLQYFNEFYSFRYNRVTLRDQKTRWGSCSSKGNLNFNWRLIMAPIEVIDYVVVHELCHLKEMNHSRRYWALVEKTTPDHKRWRKWLRDNQYLLRF